jgi:mannose-6-phosphate isomerase-like protein (cupin superfamily)
LVEQNFDPKMVQRIPLTKAKMVQRPYGLMVSLAGKDTGLENLQVVLMTVNPGECTSVHYHPFEEVFFVISGSAVFKGEDKEMLIRDKDTVVVHPNEVHQIENRDEEQSCTILIAMSPPRDPDKVVYC